MASPAIQSEVEISKLSFQNRLRVLSPDGIDDLREKLIEFALCQRANIGAVFCQKGLSEDARIVLHNEVRMIEKLPSLED
jgi:hypothetical protein